MCDCFSNIDNLLEENEIIYRCSNLHQRVIQIFHNVLLENINEINTEAMSLYKEEMKNKFSSETYFGIFASDIII